jgi:hypothetical protein
VDVAICANAPRSKDRAETWQRQQTAVENEVASVAVAAANAKSRSTPGARDAVPSGRQADARVAARTDAHPPVHVSRLGDRLPVRHAKSRRWGTNANRVFVFVFVFFIVFGIRGTTAIIVGRRATAV